ncbi:MAG: phosphatidate cytidylyltransferase [Dysgonamonadaceae bacterium]|jgi:phosphatidate cytidylyltransferase|nr:phosphatidate cytidylyltransferase [Dysgonamonadaceae bacterium]
MKNLLTRTLTGIAYAALICVGIMWNSLSFFVVFSAATVLCLWEFYHLITTRKRTKINSIYNCFGGFLLFLSAYLYASGVCDYRIFFIYLVYTVIVLISELYEKQQDPINHAAYIFLGQTYIALPLALLNMIAFRGITSETPVYNPWLIFSLFVFLWVNDTGAYLVGMAFGKHPFFERISPQKSWEGFAGGLVFTVLSAFIFARFRTEIALCHWIGLSLPVVVFGALGDLAESLIKRTLGVKDSGCSLPGHGGYLDRFDSLLLAVYAMLFYMHLFITAS